MSQVIDELKAFASHPLVDGIAPQWPLTQEKAAEIVAEVEMLRAQVEAFRSIAGLATVGGGFREIYPARGNGACD